MVIERLRSVVTINVELISDIIVTSYCSPYTANREEVKISVHCRWICWKEMELERRSVSI